MGMYFCRMWREPGSSQMRQMHTHFFDVITFELIITFNLSVELCQCVKFWIFKFYFMLSLTEPPKQLFAVTCIVHVHAMR